MTNQHHPCATAHCSRPATMVICWGCTTDLVTALRQLACGPQQRTRVHVIDHRADPPATRTIVDYLPGLIADLDDAISRQTSTTDGIGILVRQAETALPYHEAATILGHEVRNTVTTWARVLLDDNPHLEVVDTGTAAVAGWLSLYPSLLAMLAGAGEMVDQVYRLTKRVRAMVDRAPDKVYVGPCGYRSPEDCPKEHVTPLRIIDGQCPMCGPVDQVECGTDLYGLPTKETVTCPTCTTVWGMDEQRAWLRESAMDLLATTAELVNLLPTLLGGERPVADATIRSWVKRGKLDPHSPHPEDARQRPRYRIGDVIDLVAKVNDKEGSAA